MVGLPPSGYRITAQDGHLASCDGNKQAITPVGVSPRRFSAISDLGAFCFNSVLSSKSGRKLVKIVVSLGPVAWKYHCAGGATAHGGPLHPCDGADHVWVG